MGIQTILIVYTVTLSLVSDHVECDFKAELQQLLFVH